MAAPRFPKTPSVAAVAMQSSIAHRAVTGDPFSVVLLVFSSALAATPRFTFSMDRRGGTTANRSAVNLLRHYETRASLCPSHRSRDTHTALDWSSLFAASTAVHRKVKRSTVPFLCVISISNGSSRSFTNIVLSFRSRLSL